jgi:hypothetical protein
MQVNTFSVKQALAKCFDFELAKGTRLFIIIGVLFAGAVNIIGGSFAENLAPHLSLHTLGQAIPLASLSVRITHLAVYILTEFVTFPVMAGVMLLALNKQRGQEYSFTTIFSCYNKLPQFFILALVMSLIICLARPGPLNILGIHASNQHNSTLLLLFIFLPIMLLSRVFLSLAPIIIADRELSSNDAIKYSLFFMFSHKNWLKFCLFLLALAGIMAIIILPLVIGYFTAGSPSPIAHIISAVFTTISLVLSIIFYPMMIHAYSYIYNIITNQNPVKIESV